MNSSILSKKQQYAVVVLSVMVSLMVVWAAVQGATTISSNISTGGSATVGTTLSVTGNSTLTGTVVLAGGLNASSTATSTFQNGIQLVTGCFRDVRGACIGLGTSTSADNSWTGSQTFSGSALYTASTTFSNGIMSSGPLQASSTLLVTGLSNLTGFISSASSTAVGMLSVRGPVNASSTLAVTGVTYLYGNVNVNSMATVTAATGNFDTSGAITSTGSIVASSTSTTLQGVGVATSTPAAEFAADGSATTTAYLHTTKANTSPCLQMGAYRGYVVTGAGASTTGSGATWLIEAGSCK